jgi:hypothetical protein
MRWTKILERNAHAGDWRAELLSGLCFDKRAREPAGVGGVYSWAEIYTKVSAEELPDWRSVPGRTSTDF